MELFRDLIYETHPLIRFHVLYQVVEICLDKILLKELERLTQGVKEKKIYGMQIRTKFENFEAEKKRVNKLFNEYFQHQNDALKADLESVSRLFLASIGRKIEDNLGLAEIFYLVRNAIVHDYRNTGAGRVHLLAINEILPHFICDLIVHYNEETPARDESVAVQEPTGQAFVEAAPPGEVTSPGEAAPPGEAMPPGEVTPPVEVAPAGEIAPAGEVTTSVEVASPVEAVPLEDSHAEEALIESVTEGATVGDGNGAPE